MWSREQLAEFRIADLVESIRLLDNATGEEHRALRSILIRELKTRSKVDLIRWLLLKRPERKMSL